jgi:tetratricopeptide (TPR) repeat protein
MRECKMHIKFLSVLIFAMLVNACSATEKLSDQVTATENTSRDSQTSPLPQQSDLIYYTLLAELAARRGNYNFAYDSYLLASELSSDPQLPERAARIAMFTKAWEKAVLAGEKWLAVDAENIEVRHILASSYMRLKNKDAAIRQFVVIIQEHPDGVEQGMSVSYNLLKHETYQQLGRSISQTLALRFPDSPAAHFNLAQLSAAMGDKMSTIVALDTTLLLRPDYPEAILLRAQIQIESGESEAAFTRLGVALEKFPDNVRLNMGYARLLVQAGHHDLAVEAMARAYELAPNNARLMLNLGLMALEARRLTESKLYLSRVLTLRPHDSEAHYYLGRIADSQREYETAIDHYSRVSSNELQLDSQTRITELLALLGHLEQARTRLERLRAMNLGEQQQIHFILIENKILRETGHHQEALDMLNLELENYPNSVEVLYAHALAAEKMGHDDIFEQRLRSLLQIEPDNARALNALGYFLADRSLELDEAESYIRQAIAIMPTDPAIIDSLGWVSYRQGNFPEALRLLRQAYQMLFDPEIAAHLGEVLWVSGDQKSATEIWDDALRQSPEDALLNGVINRFRE